jgi:hypothetical protein
MPSDDFNDRLNRAEKIAAVVALYDTPELKLAVYQDLMGATKPAAGANVPAGGRTPPKKTTPANDADGEEGVKPKAKSAGKKQSFTFDKTIDFYDVSGPSKLNFKDFTTAHPPKSVIHKAVVALYWLSKELGLDATSVEHIYTAFKTMDWPVPADLPNTLQQAGTKNYLDSKKRDDLRLTTHGENLVEHELKLVVDA